VTDFGIAKAISSSRTRTGVILGTPNYMSPEQIMGQKIDPRSDIFSLGVVFYQLLAGELPFQGDNLSSLLYQITQVKHPPLRSFNPRIPVACEQIIDKALAKNLDERFQTAGQMAKLVRLLSLLYQITQVKHPPLRSFNPRIPVACEQIIDKALAKNLDERFQTAGQMAKLVRLLALKVDQKQKKRLAEQEAASRA